MSIKNLDEAFRLIEENFDEDECLFSGATNEKLILQSEHALGLSFPHTYRKYVQIKGFGGPGSLLISGVRARQLNEVESTGVVWLNIDARKDLAQPHHLIQIEEIGNGDTYCLDTSQMNEEGECPVVVWPIGGYEQTPILEIVAEDFGAFFLNMIKREIDYKNSTT